MPVKLIKIYLNMIMFFITHYQKIKPIVYKFFLLQGFRMITNIKLSFKKSKLLTALMKCECFVNI